MPPAAQLPDLLRQRALANGAAGRRWLDHLPGILGELVDRWGLELGTAYRGGTSAYVVAATDRAGRPCVLKVAAPVSTDEDLTFARSVVAHRIAGGRGCAELFEHDSSVAAMLLERLGPNLHEQQIPLASVLATFTSTLQDFWQPVPDECDLPTGVDKARWLARYIVATWDELGRPCPRGVVDRALAYCDRRAAAFDPARAVLVHGDAHGWNTLAANGGAHKFVDPEGVRSEPAHDLAVPMREYNEPLLAGDTARLVREGAESLAAACAVDPQAVWEWGFVERVSTGLANLRDFADDRGDAFLEVADRCL